MAQARNVPEIAGRRGALATGERFAYAQVVGPNGEMLRRDWLSAGESTETRELAQRRLAGRRWHAHQVPPVGHGEHRRRVEGLGRAFGPCRLLVLHDVAVVIEANAEDLAEIRQKLGSKAGTGRPGTGPTKT